MKTGERLGPYEILAPLGAGGMGEVYRARDTKLNREVAIKVLPSAVAADAERMTRFQREAQVLAALNHPNIAQVYGMEGAALVMELVPGETLKGPLPVDEAMAIARQIADALEAAHEKGIVHRDLKPANIKITPSGTVKVLDFGLAKAAEEGSAGPAGPDAPTMSVPATRDGAILGTASYMSPEQAKGRPVDRRADIWAYGCVLYELLTGRRAFPGDSPAEAMAAVIGAEPDWTLLPPGSPVQLLRLCLQKDQRLRLRDAGDSTLITGVSAASQAAGRSAPRSAMLPWVLATVLGTLALFAAWKYFDLRGRPQAPSIIRSSLLSPAKTALALGRGTAVVFSPDGSRVVFTAMQDGRVQIYQRALDQSESTPLPGTEGATNPFFSPDSRWVGFFVAGKLKKVAIQGGEPVTLCAAPNSRGETWADDDTIFFTPTSGSGLYRVPGAGGAPEQVTKPAKGELSHRWPQALPGGKAVLFTIWNDTGFEEGRIVALVLATGERRLLVQGGSFARYMPGGAGRPDYLIYARAGGLLAVPFDVQGLRLTGTPVPILEGLVTNLSGGAHFSLSRDGALVYVGGEMAEMTRKLGFLRPDGTKESELPVRGMSLFFTLSRDGRRIARSNPAGPNRDLWVHDLDRGTTSRLTYGNNDSNPVWSPDGKRIAYSSGLPKPNLFWKPADGSEAEERLVTSANDQFPSSFSPDGKLLAYFEFDPVTGADIWVLPLEGDRKPLPFLKTPFSESYPVFSPDGKWIAYESNESGKYEIFVQSFPSPGRKFQVSTEGGRMPQWSRDGRSLYYRNRNALMAASLQLESSSVAKPKALFEGSYELVYAVAPNGSFVVIQIERESAPTHMNLVLNWREELARRVN